MLVPANACSCQCLFLPMPALTIVELCAKSALTDWAVCQRVRCPGKALPHALLLLCQPGPVLVCCSLQVLIIQPQVTTIFGLQPYAEQILRVRKSCGEMATRQKGGGEGKVGREQTLKVSRKFQRRRARVAGRSIIQWQAALIPTVAHCTGWFIRSRTPHRVRQLHPSVEAAETAPQPPRPPA
jgi:hypothetical protein